MLKLDYIRTFSVVMRLKTLKAAAKELGVSIATISRHIKALESTLDVSLFRISAQGYEATSAAFDLASHTLDFEAMALDLERKLPAIIMRDTSTIRIAAGNWISQLIARSIDHFLDLDGINFELLNAYPYSSLAANTADIAIRNKRPANGRLKIRKVKEPHYGVYGAVDYIGCNPAALDDRRYQACQWVGLTTELSDLPTSQWLDQRLEKPPVIRCTQAMNVLDCLKAKIGLGLIPHFIGHADPELVCVEDSVQLDTGGLWIVIHEDIYQRRGMRESISALASLLAETR